MAINRDVALNIIADVKKYQSELAKIPGTTDKQAAKAALALEKRLTKAQVNAAKAAKKAASDSSRVWATVGTIITANLGTAAIKQAATAVLGWRGELAASVDEVNTLGAQTGLTNKTIAGLRLVADSSGKSLADLVPRDLAKRILETSQGIGRAKRGFDGLKISVTDGSGALKSADAVLRETIEALRGVEDPTQRAALATQALGNQGALMLSSLSSSDSLDAFADQAERLGVDVGPDAVRATAEWQASTAELSLAMEGLKESVARALDIESNIRNFTTGLLFAQELIKGFGADARAAFDTEIDVKIRKLQKEDLFDEHGVIDAVKAYENSLKQADLSQLKNQARVADSFEFAKIKASLATIEFLKARAAIGAAGDEAAAAGDEAAAAAGAQAGQAKAAASAERERLKDLTDRASALGKLQKIQSAANTSALTDEQKVIRAGAERLDQIADIEASLVELAAKGVEVADERAAAELAAIEVIADGQRKLKKIRDKDHAAELAQVIAARDLKLAAAKKVDEAAKIAREEALAAFGEGIAVAAEFGAVAITALTELQRRQADAAREALDNATSAVDRIKGEREELIAQIEAEDDAITKARLRADLLELESSLASAKKRQNRRKQDALKAWRGEKQAALGEIAFNTAVAVLKAYAQLGPPPSPFGIASAVAAGAAGLVQGAIVASQPAPQFHTGTESVSTVTRAGDVLASLSPNEAILNVRAADNLGRQSIREANLTGSAGGAQVFELNFERRHVDSMVSRTLSGGGATRTAINQITRSRPAGQVSIMGA